jgi:hypothetical protein
MTERPSSWYEHCLEAHPRSVWSCVRNLTGTAIMCCVGRCNWSMGAKRG